MPVRPTLAGMSIAREGRLATIDTLSRGIAENLPKGLPSVMGVPIAESRASASTISGGTLYGFSSSTPASNFPHHFGLYGATWSPLAPQEA